ncbi:MAG: hypothetical protein LJE93_05240 [Acidobacteria bacterium]|nr:hypothetical protein [Acidobacteriota bacterium]
MQKVQGLTRNVLVPEAGVDHGERQPQWPLPLGGWSEAACGHRLAST